MDREKAFIILSVGVIASVLLWRHTPRHAAPIDTAAKAAADTMGVPAIAPTLDASQIVGMSYMPGDGDPGPAVYCVPYPGSRGAMPPVPSAVKL